MNYKETLSYLFSRLPMYQRDGASAYKADLNNTHHMMDLLDHPEKKIKAVHIAGTNGKGSVSNFVASILMEAGYKTGLYTSPHMKDFRERILINGIMIPESEVVNFVDKYNILFEDIQPSFFEWTVALAYDYFASQQVNIAIIETGLGGRLDSTNVITPVVSVITNVSKDHMKLLGDTVSMIAKEKAGIIKANIPVIAGIHQQEVDKTIIDKASAMNSSLTFASEHYSAFSKSDINTYPWKVDIHKNKEKFLAEVEVGLSGDFQLENVCTALAVVDELNRAEFIISYENIVNGLRNVRSNFGLTGRWQILSNSPLIVTDNAHNESGIKLVLSQVNRTNKEQLHIVLGLSDDKEHDTILKLFPKDARYYFCKASVPRSLSEDQILNKANEIGLYGIAYADVSMGIKAALTTASKNDMIFIGGSTFVVADALTFFEK
jgi:dihydrofolate synthase/folylpolyglutamate synthase